MPAPGGTGSVAARAEGARFGAQGANSPHEQPAVYLVPAQPVRRLGVSGSLAPIVLMWSKAHEKWGEWAEHVNSTYESEAGSSDWSRKKRTASPSESVNSTPPATAPATAPARGPTAGVTLGRDATLSAGERGGCAVRWRTLLRARRASWSAASDRPRAALKQVTTASSTGAGESGGGPVTG